MDTCRLSPKGDLEMACVIEGCLVGYGGCGGVVCWGDGGWGAVIERVVTCGVVTVLDTPRVLTEASSGTLSRLINLPWINFLVRLDSA